VIATGPLTILVVALLIALLLGGVPIGVALLAAGGAGLLIFDGPDLVAASLGSAPFTAIFSFSLIALPLFAALGNFGYAAGIGEGFFSLLRRRLSFFPGSAAVGTIFGMAGLSAIIGSSVAQIAMLGPIAAQELRRLGHSDRFIGGLIAMTGTLGILIPPSIPLVIYGVITGESIGHLLIAALVPSVITVVAYTILTVVMAQTGEKAGLAATAERRASLAGADRSHTDLGTQAVEDAGPTPREEYGALLQVLLVTIVVIGGIYSGVFTVNESAAVGAFMCLGFLLLRFRRSWTGMRRAVWKALEDTVTLTGMICLLLVGAAVFSYFLIATRVPYDLVDLVKDANMPAAVVLAIVVLLLILMGTILEGLSILLIAVPIIYPLLIDGFSMDGIWLGIVVVKAIEIGLVTPPVGLAAFVTAGLIPGMKVETVFRGVVPFLIVDVGTLVLILIFPGLVTWLPEAIG
jgi:C4-dicarboxylate transporter, DctM subunit